HVPFPRSTDLSVAGPALPLGPPGERVRDDASRWDQRDHGALRSRAVVAARRAIQDHPLPDGADDVLAAAEAAGGNPYAVRPVVAGSDSPRGGAVPGSGETGDDRMARPDRHRVLRRDGSERVHVLR